MAKPITDNIKSINVQDITKRVRIGQGRLFTSKDVLDPISLTSKLNEIIQFVNENVQKGNK